MPTTTQFETRFVSSTTDLNYVFLVDWIIIFLSALLFVFYFHRIVGKVLTWIVGPIVWRRYHVRLSVQAMKVSLLSGRVFLKNVTIITKDEMLVIYQGTLCLRYWYRKTRVNQLKAHHADINEQINSALPSMLTLEISGMETFMYNRSAAYEIIEERLKEEMESQTSSDPFKETASDSSMRNRKQNTTIPSSVPPKGADRISHEEPAMQHTILSLLPIDITVHKGSIIIGNDTTPYIYVGYYKTMRASLDASTANSALDPYRLLHEMHFEDLRMEFCKNVSHKTDETAHHDTPKTLLTRIKGIGQKIYSPFAVHQDKEEETPPEVQNDWKGLSRYMQEFQSLESFEWQSLYEEKTLGRKEYAKESVILTAHTATVLYYYDIPGRLPEDFNTSKEHETCHPKFGLDVALSGAKQTFGPWANVQLNRMNQMLFPALQADAKLPDPPRPGQLREYVAFDLQVELLDQFLIRVPFREESKEELTSEINDLRYGWIDIHLAGGSSLAATAYSVPTDISGFKNSFNATLIKPEITSSVNGALLFKAEKHTISADIGYPLAWRGLTKWNFVNTTQSGELYLLREHVSLISDMIGDFGSAEPPSPDTFRPFIYTLEWDLKCYSIFLNINEENIIDNPIDHDRNRFISFCGDDLKLDITIPMIHQYQKSNAVDFNLTTSYFILSIDHQEWSTYNEFSETNEIGYASDFVVNGSYTYYNVVEHGAVDTIILNCSSKDTTVKLYGFVVKYFIDLKENYFGNLIHFKTYEEYTQSKHTEMLNDGMLRFATSVVPDASGFPVQTLESIERNRKDVYPLLKNETDLQLTWSTHNGCLVFPCNIYDSRSHLALHFEDIDVDLRNNNYYMDLQADFSEIKGRYIEDSDESVIFTNTKGSMDFKPDIYIDQLRVHGLRIFGLPPVEPTYFCRWTFETDGITIDSKPNILGALANAAHSFSLGHSDLENSLGVIVDPVMDIINLDFKTPFVKIKINSPNDCGPDLRYYVFELQLIKLSLSLSDQPTTQYNSALEILIEEIKVKGILDDKQILDLTTNLRFTNLCQKKNAFHRMLRQSLHLHDNDGVFHRTPWLIPEFQRDRMYMSQYGKICASLYLPRVPIPLNSQTAEVYVQALPAEVQKRFLSEDGHTSRLSTAANEKFNLSDIAFSDIDDAGDEHLYACDNQQPTNSLEYFDTLAALDPDCEHDNITVEMDKILVFVFPGMALAIIDIMSRINDVTMSKVLDELQVEYFVKVKTKIQKSLLNLNFHCDLIDLFMSQEVGDNNGLSLRCHNIDTKLLRKAHGAAEEKIGIKLSSDKLDFSIYNKRKSMVSLEIFNFFLEHMSSARNSTSISLTDFEIDVKLSHINWVVNYIKTMLSFHKLFEAKTTELKRNRRKAKIELLYQLTVISVENSILSDPQCLSAIWNQSKKDSIRRDKNWRILPRLRHILHSLPTEWRESKNALFKQNLWEAPHDADEKLQNILAGIRVWERRQDDIIDMVFGETGAEKIAPFKDVSLDLHHFQVNLSPFDRAIQIADMKFSIREDKLDPEISKIAYPLLDTEIESGIDINFEVKQFMTNFNDIKLNIGEIQQAVESIFQVLKDLQTDSSDDEIDSAKSIHDFYVENDKKPLLITSNTNIEYFKHLFEIDKAQLVVQGTNSRIFSSMIQTNKLLSFSLNFMNTYFNVAVDVNAFNTLEFQSKGFSTTVINTKPFDEGDLVFIVDNDDAEFYLGCEEGELINLMDTLVFNEYVVIKEISDHIIEQMKISEESSSSLTPSPVQSLVTSEFPSEDIRTVRENIFTRLGIKANISFNFVNFKSEINLLHPLVHKFSFNQVMMKIQANENGLQSLLAFNRTSTDVILFGVKYLSAYLRGFELNCDVDFVDEIYMFAVIGSLAESRLNCNHKDIINLIHLWIRHFDETTQRLNALKAKVEAIKENFSRNTVSDARSDNMSVLINAIHRLTRFKVSYDVTKITAWALVNGNTVQLQADNFGFDIQSFDEHWKRNLIHGVFLLPSLKLNAILNGSHGSNFTMVDASFKLSIKNPEGPSYLRQQLHITSDHFRVCAKNKLIFEAIHAYGRAMELLEYHSKVRVSGNETNQLETLDSLSRFFAIVIEANNVCVGWLLDGEEGPSGPIIGFEKASVISNEGRGNVSMMGLYLSLALGPTPETFYPTESEIKSNNRVYVPGFDLVYTLIKEGMTLSFDAKLTGDEVDLKLQTEFFEIGQPLLVSISSIEEEMSRIASHPKEHTIVHENTENPALKKSKNHMKNIINIELQFAGASVLIENQYFINSNTVSSLELKAPALDVSIGYIRDSESLKRHALIVEAHIGETENRLCCTCVPVIIDIVKSTQRYMREKNVSRVKETANAPTTSSIVSLSEKIDFNFDLKIDPQKLILNCDPRAQIEAEVYLEGIAFHLTTEHDFLAGVMVVDRLGAELKHAFSKVISGSVGLDGFILNSILSPVEGVKEVTTVGSVKDVTGYINIQQLQDLDVFKDLWFPSDLYNSNLDKVTTIKIGNKRTFGQIIRDVTAGSPLPWSVIFFIENIEGTIDLGVSLGSLNLNLERFKANSRRSQNWDHSLELSLDLLHLSSQGKIEGLLKTESMRFETSISLKQRDKILDLPLVSVGFIVGSLQSNISIDYHPFFIVKGEMLELKVFNESELKDKLTGSFKLGTFKVYMTAMMASNFVEIYSIGLRISQNIKISYRQTLNIPREQQESQDEEELAASITFYNMVSELQTRLFINVGHVEMLVFPSSLQDPQAMLFKTGSLNAYFLQDGPRNELSFKLSDVFVSLSTFKNTIDLGNLDALRTKDDPIFIFPNLKISMATKTEGNVIRYTYGCQFGDKVDIKWKIGSVYFIHQMWISHATTLKERLSFLRVHSESVGETENYKESIIESVNFEDKLKDLEMDDEFTYEWTEMPIIETPQLKDLGDATPPLEWFGFHRDKFPVLTHKFVIIGLKDLIREVEMRYSKVLK